MAGRGPSPKDPSKRARRNSDPIPTTTMTFVLGEQPKLPPRMPDGSAWPPRTRAWWRKWGRSEQAKRLTDLDWEFLLDTAVLHGELWNGDTSVAAELRLRVAKFATTMEDRARLRIVFAEADQADARRDRPQPSRKRYGGLRVVDGSGDGDAAETG